MAHIDYLEKYMKLSPKVTLVVLALSASLAACGGKATFDLTGTISGLNNNGLVLANGDQTISPAAGATSFAFPDGIDYGTDYNITIQKQPDHMTCGISSASGSAGHTTSIVAAVACTQNSYTVGGTITGLTAEGLQLNNGASIVAPAANATTFTLPNPVEDGKPYGVTILAEPAGLDCTLLPNKDKGTMGQANVTDIEVECHPE